MNLIVNSKLILNIFKRVVFFVIILVIIFPNLNLLKAETNNIEELQQKIDSTNQIKSELEKEIAMYESQLKDLGVQKDSLTNTLKTIDINAKKIAADIKLTENNIKSTQFRINELGVDIGTKKEKISSNISVATNFFFFCTNINA